MAKKIFLLQFWQLWVTSSRTGRHSRFQSPSLLSSFSSTGRPFLNHPAGSSSLATSRRHQRSDQKRAFLLLSLYSDVNRYEALCLDTDNKKRHKKLDLFRLCPPPPPPPQYVMQPQFTEHVPLHSISLCKNMAREFGVQIICTH